MKKIYHQRVNKGAYYQMVQELCLSEGRITLENKLHFFIN